MDSEIQKQSKKRQETTSFSICRISLLFIQAAERQPLCPAYNSALVHKELEGDSALSSTLLPGNSVSGTVSILNIRTI